MTPSVQGAISFRVHGQPSPHWFELDVTDANQIVIGIEDRQSKKQWRTDPMDKTYFATEDNAIPRATIRDYAERFIAYLGSIDEREKYESALITNGSDRTLVLKLPLQWASDDMVLEYKFTLKEVPLEQIDLLGARIRDVEESVLALATDRISQLEKENETLKTQAALFATQIDQLTRHVDRTPVFAQATASGQPSANEPALVWVADDGLADGVIEFLPTGPIRLAVAGVYAIDVCVTHKSNVITVIFQLQRSGATLASAQGGSNARNNGYGYGGGVMATPLRYVLTVGAEDEVSVVYTAAVNAFVEASITVTKL